MKRAYISIDNYVTFLKCLPNINKHHYTSPLRQLTSLQRAPDKKDKSRNKGRVLPKERTRNPQV